MTAHTNTQDGVAGRKRPFDLNALLEIVRSHAENPPGEKSAATDWIGGWRSFAKIMVIILEGAIKEGRPVNEREALLAANTELKKALEAAPRPRSPENFCDYLDWFFKVRNAALTAAQSSENEKLSTEKVMNTCAELKKALKTCQCPRPVNDAPDDPNETTVEQCMARGECGCDCGAALTAAQSEGEGR